MKTGWNKVQQYMFSYLFPILLLVYPLLLVNQGIDVTDTTYSLGYYRFMEEMDLTWVLATWLANVTGGLLMGLPYGNTLLGMNLYTGLLTAAIAWICYFVLSRRFPAWCVFLGEMIALSLCWCPATILYNYLTYLLFAAGSLCLYQGLRTGRQWWLAAAGVCLGMNVMVRFSNLAEAGLIVVVWYAGWLRKEKLWEICKKTGWCLAGYVAGFGSVLLVIIVRYGPYAFGEMIVSLFGMTREASDYTLGGMLSATADAYLAAFGWLTYMLPCIAAGMILFRIRKGRWETGKKILYCLGLPVLLRLYWGRGMFSFRYYNEGAVFQWMMLFLILTILCCGIELSGWLDDTWHSGQNMGSGHSYAPAVQDHPDSRTEPESRTEPDSRRRDIHQRHPDCKTAPAHRQGRIQEWHRDTITERETDRKRQEKQQKNQYESCRITEEQAQAMEQKIFAVLVLAILFLTPLGSNNYTYQNMNNLFLAAPYTLWTCFRIRKKTAGRVMLFPAQAMALLILGMTLVQGIGFGCTYVFRDGIYGEERNTRVENSTVLKGMYTSQERAENLTGLLEFWAREKTGDPVLFWGDVPGLSYILDVPSAIFTTWPEIPSNTADALAQALEELEENPDILMGHPLDEEALEGEKWELIRAFIRERGYVCIFQNEAYQVYRAE